MAIPIPRSSKDPHWTKYDKSEVRYRKYDSCSTCVNYSSFGSRCRIVDGKVKPDGICDQYEGKMSISSPHADFYKREYDKLQGK